MLLDGDEGHQPIGFGLEHLLEHRVPEDLLACERQRPFEEGLEVGHRAELAPRCGEEPRHLPPDGLAQHLVLPAGEEAVDGGARHPRLLHDVLDRRLADARRDALERPRAPARRASTICRGPSVT